MPDNPQDFPNLLQRLRQGDSDAAREIQRRFGPVVLRTVRRLLTSRLRARYDSQDFVQDVLASLLTRPVENLPAAEGVQFANFLKRMARNKVFDAYRKGGQDGQQEPDLPQSLDGSAAELRDRLPTRQPTASQLAVAQDELEHLARDQRQPQQDMLALLALGHTHQEIAARLGVSEKSVQRMLKKLLRRRPS